MGLWCHIDVTFQEVTTEASKKIVKSFGLLCFLFSSIWGTCVKNFKSIASRLLWKKYHQTRNVRRAIFSLAFFRFAPRTTNTYAVTSILEIFKVFFYKSIHNVQRVILRSFHYFRCSSFYVVINNCQALLFNGAHRGGCHRDVTFFLSLVTPKRVEIQKN